MERISLKRKEYSAKDRESGKVVEFGENVPIGASGKEYDKSYVSVPEKGGWFLKDKATGQIVSENPVVGYSDYEGMDDAARKSAQIAISVCTACAAVFQNAYYLEEHAKAAHGKTAEAILEETRQKEEASVQEKLGTPVTPSVPVAKVRKNYYIKKADRVAPKA